MSKLILGKGGSAPGVDLISADNTDITCSLELEKGQSVYAVDMDIENNLAVIGTRCGSIEILTLPEDGITSGFGTGINLFQGSGVLSVCVADKNKLISSDTAGDCFLWRLDSRNKGPQRLESGGGVICSLLKVNDSTIIGLSVTGKLLFWDINSGALTNSIDCPAPSAKSALINLCHWPAKKSLLYPASDGRLVVFNLEDNLLKSFNAHNGLFYTVIADNSHCYTIGTEDGLLKKYSEPDGFCQETFKVHENIISGQLLDEQEQKFLLTDVTGRAGIYTIEADSLVLTDRLDGNCYRTVAGPCADFRRISTAAVIKTEIENKIANSDLKGIDMLYQQLGKLGFDLTGYALKISQAKNSNDIAGQLDALRKLVSILPQDNEYSAEYLQLYADTLRTTWHLGEALEIYQNISADKTVTIESEWLNSAAEAIATKNRVIETDIALEILIQTASIMDKPFTGLWFISCKDNLPAENLNGQILADKYEQIRADNKLTDLPPAQIIKPYWIDQRSVTRTEIIIFRNPDNSELTGLCYGIRIDNNDTGCSFTPVILFDAGQPEDGQNFSQHNHNTCCRYKSISEQNLSARWPQLLFKTARDAIRQINTKELVKINYETDKKL